MEVDEIELELLGDTVVVPRDLVTSLAAAAAGKAGISSRHRELSLLLRRALESGKGSLNRAEAQTLKVVLEETGLSLPQQDGAGRGGAGRD